MVGDDPAKLTLAPYTQVDVARLTLASIFRRLHLMFHTEIPRRKSRQIMVGNVAVGGDAPISVQTSHRTP